MLTAYIIDIYVLLSMVAIAISIDERTALELIKNYPASSLVCERWKSLKEYDGAKPLRGIFVKSLTRLALM